MISNTDRSLWIGASDMKYLLGNKDTKTYKNWLSVKLGESESVFYGNEYTDFGTRAEHLIMDKVNLLMTPDVQLIDRDLRLRVNYDGIADGTIYEIKTYKGDKDFKVSNAYLWQAQIEMYMYKKYYNNFDKLVIVAYAVQPDEYYQDKEIEIDEKRLSFYEIEYDKSFVNNKCLPEIKAVAKKIKKQLRKYDIDDLLGAELF